MCEGQDYHVMEGLWVGPGEEEGVDQRGRMGHVNSGWGGGNGTGRAALFPALRGPGVLQLSSVWSSLDHHPSC